MDLAGDVERDRAHAGAAERVGGQQRRLGDGLVEVLDDRERLRDRRRRAALGVVDDERRHQLRRRDGAKRRRELLVLDEVDRQVVVVEPLQRQRDPDAVRRRRAEVAVELHDARSPRRPRRASTWSEPTPATSAFSTSPRPTAATPSGVPVKIRSPGCSSQAADRCSMISPMFQISLPIVLCWRTLPLTSSVIARLGVDLALGGAPDRPDRRRVVEALADVPRPALLLRLALQVAPRHVEADGVAPDVAHRVGGGDALAALADRDDELDLVVQVLGQGRVRHAADLALGDRQHRVGRLHEEERRLAAGEAHLLRVLDVVAADAVDAVDREGLAARAGDGNDAAGGGCDDMAHGRCFRWAKTVRIPCGRRGPGRRR